jgi:cell division protein FtsB
VPPGGNEDSPAERRRPGGTAKAARTGSKDRTGQGKTSKDKTNKDKTSKAGSRENSRDKKRKAAKPTRTSAQRAAEPRQPSAPHRSPEQGTKHSGGSPSAPSAAKQTRKRGATAAERARRLRERLVLEGAIHDPGDHARPAPVSRQAGPDRPTPARALSTRVITLSIILIVSGFTLFPATTTYLRQQGEYRAAQAKIAKEEATKERLTDELKRWDDPEYVKQQARERIGQAEPGETQYVVKGEAKTTRRTTSVEPGQYRQGLPWGDGLWDSVMRASTP